GLARLRSWAAAWWCPRRRVARTGSSLWTRATSHDAQGTPQEQETSDVRWRPDHGETTPSLHGLTEGDDRPGALSDRRRRWIVRFLRVHGHPSRGDQHGSVTARRSTPPSPPPPSGPTCTRAPPGPRPRRSARRA